jgi:hypothetical protein
MLLSSLLHQTMLLFFYHEFVRVQSVRRTFVFYGLHPNSPSFLTPCCYEYYFFVPPEDFRMKAPPSAGIGGGFGPPEELLAPPPSPLLPVSSTDDFRNLFPSPEGFGGPGQDA